MSWWVAAILGIVQGLTEFLPISSSAHLAVIGQLLPGGTDPGAAFTAIIQIGTEVAVILYFRKQIVTIITAWFKSLTGRVPRNDPDARMGWLIIIGTLPIVFFGLLFQDAIEHTFRDLYLIAMMLIVFAIILGAADSIAKRKLHLEDISYRDGFLFGLAQSLALIPGVSRSGGTITAGLLMGYTREAAARYSFLLAIPAVLGSGFFQLIKAFGDPGANAAGPLATLIAAVLAFVVGYFVIIAFLKIVSTYSYKPFVYYRIGFGVLIIVLCLVGVLNSTPNG